MNKKAAIVVVLLVLVSGMTWSFWRDRESPEMKEARQMHENLLDEAVTNSMTKEQQANAWAELKEKAETLSEQEQAQLWGRYKEEAMKEKREYLDRFFSLKTKEQRDAFLGEAIDRERGLAKEKKSAAKESGKGGSRAKGQGKLLSSASAEQQHAELKQLWRSYLNSTTADQRGREWAYWKALQDRRKERGLPTK
jgi:hypothetical protein